MTEYPGPAGFRTMTCSGGCRNCHTITESSSKTHPIFTCTEKRCKHSGHVFTKKHLACTYFNNGKGK